MDYKIQKDLHDRFRADTGLKLCIGNRLQYIEWLEQQAEKLFATPVVINTFSLQEVWQDGYDLGLDEFKEKYEKIIK